MAKETRLVGLCDGWIDGYTVESDQRVTRTSSEVVRQIQTHPLCFMNHVKKLDRRGASGVMVLTEVWTWPRPRRRLGSCN